MNISFNIHIIGFTSELCHRVSVFHFSLFFIKLDNLGPIVRQYASHENVLFLKQNRPALRTYLKRLWLLFIDVTYSNDEELKVFWRMAPCRLACIYQSFGRISYFQLQGQSNWNTSIRVLQFTWRLKPEDCSFYQHLWRNAYLTSYSNFQYIFYASFEPAL